MINCAFSFAPFPRPRSLPLLSLRSTHVGVSISPLCSPHGGSIWQVTFHLPFSLRANQMQQPLNARQLEKNLFITWRNSLVTYHPHALDWDLSNEEYRLPIMEPSPRSDKHLFSDEVYSFDKKKHANKNHIIIQEPPIQDYFKASLFACLTCFWMIGGIICLIQSIQVRRLLKKNDSRTMDEAKKRSNRLHTNLVLTYVIGGMTVAVLITTVLVTFFVGIKGYFGRSL